MSQCVACEIIQIEQLLFRLRAASCPDMWTSESLRRLSTPEGNRPATYFLYFSLKTPKYLQDIILCPQLEFRNFEHTSLSHPPFVAQALPFLPLSCNFTVSTNHAGLIFWFRSKSGKQPLPTKPHALLDPLRALCLS